MMTKTLSVIVACSSLLLVKGLDFTRPYENGTVDPSHRIINGERANPADFRYLVRMVAVEGASGNECGGSIISNHFILTAAHCFYGKICRYIQIFPSTWRPGDVSDLHAINCFPHEMATGRTFPYDIGLVEILEDLLMDGRFVKIDLPPPGMIYEPGDEGIIAGWGLREDGAPPGYLIRGRSPVYSWNECNKAYEHAKACSDNMICPVPRIPDNVFCTLGATGCLGDSGGPVVINGMLAGIMSGIIISPTRLCGAENPGLNQDVSYLMPWIEQKIQYDRGPG